MTTGATFGSTLVAAAAGSTVSLDYLVLVADMQCLAASWTNAGGNGDWCGVGACRKDRVEGGEERKFLLDCF